MLSECIEGLNVKDNGVYFDGTLGGGGHSYEILRRSAPNGKLIATDLDDYAIKRASERLSEFDGRFTIVKDNFKNFIKIKEDLNVDTYDGIILDLGVSSFQLDDKDRGFSYMAGDKRLDMRMDEGSSLTAEYVVNNYSESQLKRIFIEYGEERFASKIAQNIIAQRKIKPYETIGELNLTIEKSIPKKLQNDGHPSKRVFQAIRIEVNGELNELYSTLLVMARSLKKGGRMAVISFHSLEDRIVKRAFRELEIDCICDKSLPVCICGKKKEVEIITKHPITATKEELEQNSRSKSAKLRIIEKI